MLRFKIEEHGIISDLNIGLTLRAGFGAFATNPGLARFVLTSPSGTEVLVMDYWEQFHYGNTRVFDDESAYDWQAYEAAVTVGYSFDTAHHYPDFSDQTYGAVDRTRWGRHLW